MATVAAPEQKHAWPTFTVATFGGMFDTHIKTGEDYDTATLAEIFAMEPADKAKGSGPAFIPSSYADYDAREHAVQRDRGSFVALTGDVDSGDHKPAAILQAVKAFAPDCAHLIYSSAHARPGDMRWRIILPLAEPVPFETWHDAQISFFAFMEAQGIAMDHALARAAQPVYSPNVPVIHAKSDTALRSEDGKPLYYKRTATSLDMPGLDLAAGNVADGIAALRRKRLEDEHLRERIRREAEKRRATLPRGDGASLMDDFNAANSVADLLARYGYEQSPRNGADWRSPNQTGETARSGSACRAAMPDAAWARSSRRAASATPTICSCSTSTAAITRRPIGRWARNGARRTRTCITCPRPSRRHG